jgi:CysZ protein
VIGSAISKALEQIWEPAFRKVLLWSLLWTVLLFVALAVGVSELIDYAPQSDNKWINFAADTGAWMLFLFAAWFLFPAFATAIMGLFLDDAAQAVEQKYYPMDPPGVALGMGPAFWEALKLGLVILGVNIAAIPIYIVALFIPPVGPLAVYYVINGYLLGREYFELVGMRHLRPPQVKALRRTRRGSMIIYGVPIAFVFSIPVVNLVAPLFGTAYMMHIFKALSRDS